MRLEACVRTIRNISKSSNVELVPGSFDQRDRFGLRAGGGHDQAFWDRPCRRHIVDDRG